MLPIYRRPDDDDVVVLSAVSFSLPASVLFELSLPLLNSCCLFVSVSSNMDSISCKGEAGLLLQIGLPGRFYSSDDGRNAIVACQVMIMRNEVMVKRKMVKRWWRRRSKNRQRGWWTRRRMKRKGKRSEEVIEPDEECDEKRTRKKEKESREGRNN